MTDQKIQEKLKSGYEKITPDVLDSVLKDAKEQKGQILVMENRKPNRCILRYAGIAAAILLLIGGFWGFRAWQADNRVTSIVSLDVNPSIEIQINEKEKVLEVTPLNEDGRTIVGEMDFKGSSLDVTVNALIGSMLRNGYLSELANSVLVSIKNDDPQAAAALEQRMMAMISDLLGDADLEAAVLGQVVSENKAADDMAAAYDISAGKARLIEALIAADPKYSAEELSQLSINELNNLYSGHKAAADTVKEITIDSVGKASTQAYIGAETAVETALKHAGIEAGEASNLKSSLDWEDGRMVYEVEFDTAQFEYEYDIDARTGEIVKVEKENRDVDDIDDDDDDDRDDDDRDDDDDKKSSSKGSSSKGSSSKSSSSGTSSSSKSSTSISKTKAKSIALAKAGVSTGKISGYSIETDIENGKQVYEIEFNCGGYEYSITVDAATGKVLEYDREKD